MRTTIRLDQDLLRRAKMRAVESHRTLTSIIEEALRTSLMPRLSSTSLPPLHIVPFRGKGTRRGVDLTKTSTLLAAEDEARYRPRR